MRKGKTINDAAHEWVNGFNAIPTGIIDKLMSFDREDWHEVTIRSIGERVYCNKYDEYGEIESYDDETEEYVVVLDNDNRVRVDKNQVELDDPLPMWSTMWSFGDSADDYWLEELGGIQQMSQCGFRIYESYEFGYFFGIDGAGYNFYEEHWIPLYKARGLQWHDEAAEKEYQMRQKGYRKRKLGLKEYWFDGDKAIEEV